MNTAKRLITPIIAIALCIVLIGTLVKHRSNLPYKLDGSINTNSQLVLVMDGVQMVGRNHGQKSWSFKADSAEVTQGQVATTFRNLREGQIFQNEKSIMTVSAGKAVYISGVGDIQVTDKVKVVSTKGFTADTDKAFWAGYYQRLTCPGKVTFMAKGGDKLIGKNLMADWKSGEISMDDGKMLVSVPEEENPTNILNVRGNN